MNGPPTPLTLLAAAVLPAVALFGPAVSSAGANATVDIFVTPPPSSHITRAQYHGGLNTVVRDHVLVTRESDRYVLHARDGRRRAADRAHALR